MKKILIFSLSYYPRVSGAEIAVKEITDRIPKEEIEFSMVTMRFSTSDFAEDQIGNVRVYRIGLGDSYISKMLFIPRAALFAAKLHQEKKFDALWALMSYMVMPIVILGWGGIRLPYALTLQDGDPFEHVFNRARILPFKKLLVKGFRSAAVVQVISNYLSSWVRTVGYQGVVEVIPNGVAIEKFMAVPEQATLEKIQEKINKRQNELWLVHTGRLVEKNGLDVVVKALPLLPLSVHFLMIGNGPEAKTLRDEAERLGVGARVHFMNAVQNTDIPLYLHACDIFIRPSRTEGLGSSFLEAFAVGIPVIATQEGGIKDFLFDATRNPGIKPTGFAVDPNSPEQINTAVRYIFANPDVVKGVLANAQALVKKTYDWDTIAKDMKEKVFSRL